MREAGSPLVSILVPLYNHEGFIEKCLDSIIEDPYPEKEIVVLDDGSPDSSAQVVRAWHERNAARLGGRFEFKTRENRGVSRTLNELVSMANGDFIAFVSSDDYLLPGGIAARLDYLRQHPEKMAVVADYVVVDQHEATVHTSGIEALYRARKRYLAHPELITYELIFHWCLAGPVYLFRREIFQILGGYDETLAIEDWDFALRILARNQMGFIDYPAAAYRLHGSNSIHDQNRAVLFRNALIATIAKNIRQFNVLQRAFLFALILEHKAAVYKIIKGNRVKRFFCQKIGHELKKKTRWIYHTFFPCNT